MDSQFAERSSETGSTTAQPDKASPDVEGGRGRSPLTTPGGAITTLLIVVALVVGTYALYRLDRSGDDKTDQPQRFQLDLADQLEVPAELLGYTERSRIPVSLQEPTAIALGPQGQIYVAGDQAIEVLDSAGVATDTIRLDGHPACLAVAGQHDTDAGRVYVVIERHVVVLSPQFELLQQWPDLAAKSTLTAIAVAGNNVFIADAGQRVVWRFDSTGELQGKIGQADPDRQMPGFVIPSPYFDVVVDGDEVLHVVNSGMRRIEAYSFEGELQSFWGHAGSGLADFFGCCNPAHLALLPDGRFVTSEKGIPRVKVYSAAGDLEQVVAGPQQLGVRAAALGDARGNQKERVFDVAVDASGNVLVLDAHKRCVMVFQPQAQRSETKA